MYLRNSMTKLDFAIKVIEQVFSSVQKFSFNRSLPLFGYGSRTFYKGKLQALSDVHSILCSIKKNDAVEISKYGY